MIDTFFRGLSAYSQAPGFVSRHRLWAYIWIPSLLSLLAGLLIAGWGLRSAGTFGERLAGFWPGDWPLKGFIDSIFSVLAGLVLLIVLLFSFRYIIMLVVSPFLGPLSEKTERILTGSPAAPFSLKAILLDLVRSLRVVLRCIAMELFYTILLLPLNLIPVIGSAAYLVLLFLIQSYYAGFGNIDPVLERRQYSVAQRVRFAGERRALIAGNGAGFVLLLLIPVIGWVLAPVYGTIAATISGIEALDSSRKKP